MADICLLEVTTLGAFAYPGADEGWLTPVEQTRLQTILAPLRQRQYLAGHWLVRVLAARSFGGEARQWRWDDQAGPRPQLLRDGVRAWATLSHSGEHLAAAVAPQPIGLDLEWPHRRRDVMALARHMFAPDEVSRLHDIAAGPERERLFYLFWALKEARGKRGGEGLQATQARRVSARAGPAGAAEARVWPLGDTGALAVAGWPGLVIQAGGLPAGIVPAAWTYVAVD